MSEEKKIHITAEPQAIPSNCLFRVDRSLHVGSLYVSNKEWAQTWSPLAAALFDALEGLKGVRVSGTEVLISMAMVPRDWREVARTGGSTIRDFLNKSSEVFKPGAIEALEGHDLMRNKAQVIIDDTLNPGLASHGGWVEIQASDGKDLFISMGGGCQGCGSAAMTMKQGVEVAIRNEVPEVEGIHDATDHAAGVNPYM
ncbi:MAG: NifU family protein [Planctomycetota bacterium]|nr:NifU family protein [Planctomycetota bacterium]MDA1113460.1 NifU family protein [Planctomycetota bacterium]